MDGRFRVILVAQRRISCRKSLGLGERILRFGHNIRQLSPSRKLGDSTYSIRLTPIFFFPFARKNEEMQGWTEDFKKCISLFFEKQSFEKRRSKSFEQHSL